MTGLVNQSKAGDAMKRFLFLIGTLALAAMLTHSRMALADGPFFPPDPYEEPDPCDGNDGYPALSAVHVQTSAGVGRFRSADRSALANSRPRAQSRKKAKSKGEN